jgi:hypothetical protein
VTIPSSSSSSHKWFLVAGVVDLVPASASTPDAFQAGMCILAHCDDPGANCEAGAPVPSYWTSDLKVSHFDVRAQTIPKKTSEKNNSTTTTTFCNISNTNHYGMYNFLDLSSNAIFPLSFPENVSSSIQTSCGNIKSGDEECGGSFFSIEFNQKEENDNNKVFFSGGIWLAAKGN